MEFKCRNGTVSCSDEKESIQPSSMSIATVDSDVIPRLSARDTTSQDAGQAGDSPRPLSEGASGVLPGPNEVDALVAQEFNRMSPGERERAFQDLHCVKADIPGESPETIIEAMEQVRGLLGDIDPANKVACDIAQKQNP